MLFHMLRVLEQLVSLEQTLLKISIVLETSFSIESTFDFNISNSLQRCVVDVVV